MNFVLNFKNKFENESICIYNIISLKRKVHKIEIFHFKNISK